MLLDSARRTLNPGVGQCFSLQTLLRSYFNHPKIEVLPDFPVAGRIGNRHPTVTLRCVDRFSFTAADGRRPRLREALEDESVEGLPGKRRSAFVVAVVDLNQSPGLPLACALR